jgi:hypothetical protein
MVLIPLLLTVTDDEGNTETQVISLIVTSVNDAGSFSGNTSATGSEDDSAITGTLTFTDAIDGDSAPNYAHHVRVEQRYCIYRRHYWSMVVHAKRKLQRL